MFFFRQRHFIGLLCLSLWLLAAGSSRALAQEKPSPEKIVLIKELLQLTNAGEVAKIFTDSTLVQLESTLPHMLNQTIGLSPDIAPSQKTEIDQKVTALTKKLLQRFREEMPKRVNFAQVIEQLSLSIYDRYFTESELKDLISFYRSPTGQKLIKVMPGIIPEILQEADKLLTPPITTLFTDLMEEMKNELPKVETSAPAPAGKPGAPVKKKP